MVAVYLIRDDGEHLRHRMMRVLLGAHKLFHIGEADHTRRDDEITRGRRREHASVCQRVRGLGGIEPSRASPA